MGETANERGRGARVVLEDVTLHRGGRAVVSCVSLTIEPGELLVLIGPSGSGKSTLLSSIARLVERAEGRILVDGRDVREVPPHVLRRGIGYCFQGLGLFPHLNVEENIAITPRLLGWPAVKIAEKVGALIEAVGLSQAHRARMPHELSGGQAQRVAVARSLAAEPPLLLLDEPFGALDPETRALLQTELRALHERLGVTTLLVSHDLGEALLLGDRVAVLIDGVLVQLGAPGEIVRAPASDAVRALIAPAIERSRALSELAP